METSLHHVEICVRDGEAQRIRLCSMLGLSLLASRQTPSCHQWVLRGNGITLTVTEPLKDELATISELEDWTVFCGDKEGHLGLLHTTDSVFNVALRVKDVSKFVNRCRAWNGGSHGIIIKPLTVSTDEFGTVKYAIIKSCVGNIVHTLIDDSNYKGAYLPGYHMSPTFSEETTADQKNLEHHNKELDPNSSINDSRGCKGNGYPRSKSLYDGIDHLAFACPVGSYASILRWYSGCLGFERHLVNRDESSENGYVIDMEENVGMRLVAMKYYKCAENCIVSSPTDPNHSTVKLVLAESLAEETPDTLNAFMKVHGGPGIHHIALRCGDILGTLARLQDKGLQFLITPKEYYDEVIVRKRIREIGLDLDTLSKTGILVDGEDEIDGSKDGLLNKRYLLQIFSHSLFGKDTFFLELIERHGTEGFGAGNIPALWRIVSRYNAKDPKIPM